MKQLELFPDPNQKQVTIIFWKEDLEYREKPLITAMIEGTYFVGHGFDKETAAKNAVANMEREWA